MILKGQSGLTVTPTYRMSFPVMFCQLRRSAQVINLTL